jgi:hypothetical protein
MNTSKELGEGLLFSSISNFNFVWKREEVAIKFGNAVTQLYKMVFRNVIMEGGRLEKLFFKKNLSPLF